MKSTPAGVLYIEDKAI